jgi:PIN domain nuclease of toxin-antitoxin system
VPRSRKQSDSECSQPLGDADQTAVGQAPIGVTPQQIIESQQQTNRIEILPITMPHVFTLGNLPSHHKDPFDRLLIAQAIVEDAILVTGDRMFSEYPINVAW